MGPTRSSPSALVCRSGRVSPGRRIQRKIRVAAAPLRTELAGVSSSSSAAKGMSTERISEARDATRDERRWNAVVDRDSSHDGRFFYAVRTTGVYCRPSCPSRRPLRSNVRFFAGADSAEQEGYRPCKRCRPRERPNTAESAVATARAYLDAHPDRAIKLSELASVAGMSPHHLQRTFKRIVGVSPKQYSAALRADRLKAHLRTGGTVSRASFDAGYGASSRVYQDAAARLGMTPAAYRRGGAGVLMRFATQPVSLGWLLVAATSRGVCAAFIGDSAAGLEQALESEFPAADRLRVDLSERGQDDLRAWLEAIAARIAGRIDPPEVPTEVSGTPLQERVWNALRKIPPGETRTYAEVARAVGVPRAVRAVASACARNRIALVVPCHRVVRGDGGLGGYRWGLERKRELLASERAAARRSATSITVRDLSPDTAKR